MVKFPYKILFIDERTVCLGGYFLMDIASLSIAVNTVQVKQQAGISIMKKVIGGAEENKNAILEMMQTPVGQNVKHPTLGNTIDMKR